MSEPNRNVNPNHSPPPFPLQPDLDQAERFLTRLDRDDPHGDFTFLAIDDDKTRNNPPSPEKHGALASATNFFKNATARGYGVYVTVNRTDLKGRKKENILAVRALFVDLDGAPILPVLNCEIPPDIVVESSRGKYHAYWLNDGSITLDNFTSRQKGLIAKFNGDKCVHDLPRIMRLPGSWHQKVSKEGARSEPFQTKVIRGGRAMSGDTLLARMQAMCSAPASSEGHPAAAKPSTKTANDDDWTKEEPAPPPITAPHLHAPSLEALKAEMVPIDAPVIEDYGDFDTYLRGLAGGSGGNTDFLAACRT